LVSFLNFYFRFYCAVNLPNELTAATAGNCCTWFHCLRRLLVLLCVAATTTSANHHKICIGVLQYDRRHCKEYWNHRTV